jgi:hypothetical protein
VLHPRSSSHATSAGRRPLAGLVLLAAALLSGSAGCGGEDAGALDGIDSIVFLQRKKQNETGDIFQYRSYHPTARIVTLTPPTADGQLDVLCCEGIAGFENVDIASYDLSFDAREIVFAGKLAANQTYGLFLYRRDDHTVEQLATDPTRDYQYPVFLPGDKIMFMTNAVVEPGAPQHVDEYERGETLQLGVMSKDGTNELLGARNLSHRVFPSLLSDGTVVATQWDHLGDENSGHLMIFNPDMTRMREAFGKEGTGITNSYLKAREIAPGRVIAIGTARDRTVQSGTLLDIRLGEACGDGTYTCRQAEANASYRILSADVPLGREPSFVGVGRYYDAFPLNAREAPDLLVSWADGPVESNSLAAAGLSADFGVYLYDSRRDARRPIFNDPEMWDVMARPLVARAAPPAIEGSGKHQFNQDATLIGSMDVYQSTTIDFVPGSIFGVRVIEGFSGEEGVGQDFGLTEHEGAAVLGISPVKDDGSWAALIPANVPVHLQAVDRFGMSLESEPVWFSGGPGESRFCGGCHEDRAAATVIQPGLTQAVTDGPSDLLSTTPRAERASTNFSRDAVRGVPWNQALQPIFTAKCVDACHDGTKGRAGNKTWTIMDPETGMSMEWTFNLSGDPVEYAVGDMVMPGYSASHLSLMGPDMIDLEREGLVIGGDFTIYIEPTDAANSKLIQKLNPVQQFPTQNPGVRAFDTTAFPPHAAQLGVELTPDEYYLLTLAADLGGQFYSRENAPNAGN